MAAEKNIVLEFLLRIQWGLPGNSMGVPELHDVPFKMVALRLWGLWGLWWLCSSGALGLAESVDVCAYT